MFSLTPSRGRVAKVYVSYGKDVMENFIDRATGRNGHVDLQKASRKAVRDWAIARYGKDAKVKVTWSWKLGCSCPCSPGFAVVINNGLNHPDARATEERVKRRGGYIGREIGPLEVWVNGSHDEAGNLTYTFEPPVATTEEA